MAAGSVARVIRSPGRLVADPTDLSLDFPHGGTEVGKTRLAVLQSFGSNFRVECEGLGQATDVLEGPNQFVFSCLLRGWDDDAVAKFLSGNYIQGGVSRHAVYSAPGSKVPGASALGRVVTLLLEPDDPIRNPSVLIYRGIPDWTDGAEMAFQRGEELGIPLAVECMARSSDGRIVAVGMLSDLA